MHKPSQTRKKKKDRLFWPPKYYKGLTLRHKQIRAKEIKKFGAMNFNDPKAYVGFKTDAYATLKKQSPYTVQWNKLFPNAKSLKQRSQVTGVPLKYIDHVYRKAYAAWRSGHRPGITNPKAWTYPRVSSFLLCGKAHYTADAAVVRRAKKESASARKWFKRCKTSKLTSI